MAGKTPDRQTRLPNPSITIRELFDEGLLRRDKGGSCSLIWRKHPLLSRILKVNVRWDPVSATVKLNLTVVKRESEQSFAIVRFYNGLVEHIFFVCPESGLRCSALYYAGEDFGSRHAKALRYPSQIKAGRLAPDGKRSPRLRRSAMSPDDRLRARGARENGMDTASALREGQGLTSRRRSDEVEETFETLDRASDGVANSRALSPDIPIAFWEDHPRLDLRVLAQAGWLRRGELSGVTLMWTAGAELLRCDLYIDLRKAERAYIGVDGRHMGKHFYQAIRLQPLPANGRKRYMMTCPATWSDVEVMAFREGRFASKLAQRLVNASQRPDLGEPRIQRPTVADEAQSEAAMIEAARLVFATDPEKGRAMVLKWVTRNRGKLPQ